MKKFTSTTVAALIFAFIFSTGFSLAAVTPSEAFGFGSIKKAAKKVGGAAKKTGKSIGRAAKKAGKSVGTKIGKKESRPQ